MVYARTVNGQELTFGVSGMLLKNALVMYDHQTSSLWSQFLGEAIDGPFDGMRLELLSAQVTTWERWKQEHPSTTAIDKRGFPPMGTQSFFFAPGGIDPFGASEIGLNSHDLVLGLVGRTNRAYPLRYLQESSVVNDRFDNRHIVITYDGIAGARVYARSVDGAVLTFRAVIDGDGQASLMRDNETNSLWRSATGVAIDGPLTGTHLPPLPSHLSFWFAWNDYYPNAELYSPDG